MFKRNHAIVFYEIHPVNIIPALVLNIFYRVVYWRKSGIPLIISRLLEQIYLPGSFTLGEWVAVTAPIHSRVSAKLDKNRFKHRVHINYDNASIDLTLAAMQRVLMQYERVVHFYKLIEYWYQRQGNSDSYSVADYGLRHDLCQLNMSVENNNFSITFKINIFFDRFTR